MLIKLFQDEDNRFGVVNEHGVLQNSERPLNPNDSYLNRKNAYDEAARSIVTDSAGNKSVQSPLHLIDNHMDVSQRLMQSQSSGGKQKSKTQKSLNQAIQAANDKKSRFENDLTKHMNNFAKSYDLRAVIFGTFYRCGFDLHELTPIEKQQMEII